MIKIYTDGPNFFRVERENGSIQSFPRNGHYLIDVIASNTFFMYATDTRDAAGNMYRIFGNTLYTDLRTQSGVQLGVTATDTRIVMNDLIMTEEMAAVTPENIGLGLVDNTPDADKPISTAQNSRFTQIENANSTQESEIDNLEIQVTALQAAHTSQGGEITALQGSLSSLDGEINALQAAAANNAQTDPVTGKLRADQIPDAVLGAAKFKGTWNTTTNIVTSEDPALNGNPLPGFGPANNGWYFIVSAFTLNQVVIGKTWEAGDWAISTGVSWEKIDNTDLVKSVNGRVGVITLDKTDVGLSNVQNIAPIDLPVSTAQQTAINNAVSGVALQNDGRFPTATEKAALAGTTNAPGNGNRFVTNDDPRNTNARTPTAHGHSASEIVETTDRKFISYAHNAVAASPKLRTYSIAVPASGAGNVTIYLTDTGLVGGAAVFAAVNSIIPIVNDSTKNYTYGWTLSGDRKTLVVNVKYVPNVVVALVTVLGLPTNVPDGTTVSVTVAGS